MPLPTRPWPVPRFLFQVTTVTCATYAADTTNGISTACVTAGDYTIVGRTEVTCTTPADTFWHAITDETFAGATFSVPGDHSDLRHVRRGHYKWDLHSVGHGGRLRNRRLHGGDVHDAGGHLLVCHYRRDLGRCHVFCSR
mmetsp:Transcript_59224/g.136682  ORF Transcript_59224/g.136682 Transcript_59224/m.136682 type:complete len:140 (+) Transcript_59224:34-453(+)